MSDDRTSIYAPELEYIQAHGNFETHEHQVKVSEKKSDTCDPSQKAKETKEEREQADLWSCVSGMCFMEAMSYAESIKKSRDISPPVEVLHKMLYRAVLEIEYANMLKSSISRLLNTRPARPA